MLAGSASATPRPRPPARSRRASSHVKSTPPPPYRAASHLDVPTHSELVEDPVDSVRGSGLNHLSLLSQSDQWTERSKEELSGLLQKADELIKDREHELDFTTAVCKSLYENNLELKNRHRALLARLPHSPASSSPGSSATSPTSSNSKSPRSPYSYSANTSRSSPNASLHAPRVKRHHRRVSVSPSDLALLSDQNAELLAKLERLEAESTQAEQAGRKKLRSLEKEIQGLREELEKTRAKSDELEERARVASGTFTERDEEASRKRREREERFRALRTKTEGDATSSEVRDFAPGSAVSTQPDVLGLGRPSNFQRRRHISEAVFRPLRSQDDVIPERPRRVSLQNGLTRSASEPNQLLFPVSTPPTSLTHEYALVSQLLLKIQELEETNTQITERQTKTAAQLRQVQQDAASIRLAYESLGDGDGVEWVNEESGHSPGPENDEAEVTIRFASLRRSLSADASTFTSEIDVDVQSSLKHMVIPEHIPPFSHVKARRSVVGLFDPPDEILGQSSTSVEQGTPSIVSLTIPGLPPVPFVPQPSKTSATPSTSRSPSPLLSPNLPGGTPPHGEDVPYRRTLDSELCAAFDGTWEGTSDNHHFRTSSLASLTSSQHGKVMDTFSPTDDPHSLRLPISEPQQTTGASASTLPSFQANGRPRAGTWQEDRSNAPTSPFQPPFETADEKKRRKSQTIRMRTARWNEGRFGGTLLPSEKRSGTDISRPSTPIPERLANVFEAVVDTIKRSKSDMESSQDTTRDDQTNSAGNTSVVLRSQPPRQGGLVAFVLEIWLWLQFVIIIVVFIWAMAKRGPKSVLEEAGRKRIGSSKVAR